MQYKAKDFCVSVLNKPPGNVFSGNLETQKSKLKTLK